MFTKSLTSSEELKSVLSDLPPLARGRTWIVGGALRRALTGAPQLADFDFCFASHLALTAFRYDLTAKGFAVSKDAKHVTELTGVAGGKFRTVQLLKLRVAESMESCVTGFDFTICQMAYDGETLVAGKDTMADVAFRVLRPAVAVSELKYPASTYGRVRKCQKQGYTIERRYLDELRKAAGNAPLSSESFEDGEALRALDAATFATETI